MSVYKNKTDPPQQPNKRKNLPSDWNIQILCGTRSFQNQSPIKIVDCSLASMKKPFVAKYPIILVKPNAQIASNYNVALQYQLA